MCCDVASSSMSHVGSEERPLPPSRILEAVPKAHARVDAQIMLNWLRSGALRRRRPPMMPPERDGVSFSTSHSISDFESEDSLDPSDLSAMKTRQSHSNKFQSQPTAFRRAASARRSTGSVSIPRPSASPKSGASPAYLSVEHFSCPALIERLGRDNGHRRHCNDTECDCSSNDCGRRKQSVPHCQSNPQLVQMVKRRCFSSHRSPPWQRDAQCRDWAPPKRHSHSSPRPHRFSYASPISRSQRELLLNAEAQEDREKACHKMFLLSGLSGPNATGEDFPNLDPLHEI
eukprot:Gregarina_sp_Poly_1__1709@NODE_143_length_12919_cov_90_642857_g128_i0_p4_GENE_NODE_143_length_12919_cov_90_642857_g128_i0NODE_143_length_12919_cov_90_642857_g128_i0_p4_ORF_typecomplete_len288_score27_62_NODE_143_length_12919_cov_90_642857_g128_i057246587